MSDSYSIQKMLQVAKLANGLYVTQSVRLQIATFELHVLKPKSRSCKGLHSDFSTSNSEFMLFRAFLRKILVNAESIIQRNFTKLFLEFGQIRIYVMINRTVK